MSRKLIVKNKKALFEYDILETLEAGLVLQGTEIKSIREGRVNLKESFARIHNGEVWLEGCHISPYSHGNIHNHDPIRSRKLLLHRREIHQLVGKVEQKGLTLIPLALYLSNGKAKLDLAVGRGKKLHDKRETARRKTLEREIEAELKRR
ncbi:MAG TPA: SsrA-binding protein SmpB [Acidobacteriota bacterium]|nr:SsrA-binding protein SmpB [Acidobacteriota bacterium]